MTLAKLATAGLVIAAAYVALPARSGTVEILLARPAQTATGRLEAKRRIVEGSGLGSLTIESDGKDGQALRIGVTRAGDPKSVACRVAVTPVSPDMSRAAIDCTQPNAGDQPMRRLGSQALNIIVGEHVAATVEERPYDTDRVADRMIALVATNTLTIASSMSAPQH